MQRDGDTARDGAVILADEDHGQVLGLEISDNDLQGS